MKKMCFLSIAALAISAANIATSEPGSGQKFLMEGFDPLAPKAATYMSQYTNYAEKLTTSLWEYPLEGNLAVSWTTPIVPAELKGKPVIFVIQAGLGTSKGNNGWHELFVNGENVLKFNTPLNENNIWQGKACFLSFHALLVDGNNDMMGVMYIEVSPEYIKYGQPQKFTVKGGENNSLAYFMLFEGSAGEIKIEPLQRQNKVSKRILSVKSVFVPPDAPIEYIAKWRGMKQAAWSASAAPVKSPDVLNFIVSGKTEDEIRKAIDDAIAAQRWINEVYPDQKSLQNIPAGHLEWLKKLDCVLWLSGPEKIQRYTKLRKSLKVSSANKGETLRLVTLSAADKTLSHETVTLQIPLPKTTWDASVSVNGESIAANFIYLKDEKGISFDLEVGKISEIKINQ